MSTQPVASTRDPFPTHEARSALIAGPSGPYADAVTGLPLNEAARYLGISVVSLRRKVKSGEVSHHRDERGRIIVELSASTAPLSQAADPSIRELVQLRVEVGILRQDRAALLAAIEHYWKHTDALAEQIARLIEQVGSKDALIEKLVRAGVMMTVDGRQSTETGREPDRRLRNRSST